MCYALAVNWVPEKRSRSEQLGDISNVTELKIDDDDDDKGNAEVSSLDRMRGQTELDRRSLSKSIFRLEYMSVGTEWRESNGDSTLDYNGDYQVQSCGGAEMSQRTGVDSVKSWI